MAIVLDPMPKTIRPQTKPAFRKPWQRAMHKDIKTAFDYFNATQETTHPQASACPANDHGKQRTLYYCPATKKK